MAVCNQCGGLSDGRCYGCGFRAGEVHNGNRRQRIAELEAQLAEQQEDSELLDWMDDENYEGEPRLSAVLETWWHSGVDNVRDAIRVTRDAVREEPK